MFAILMLFIAPVVSRSLEHVRAGSAGTTVMADCGMEMPMHHGMHSPPPEPEKASQPLMQHGGGHHNMAMMMDDSACGYCVLLLHAPLLDVSHARCSGPGCWLRARRRFTISFPCLPTSFTPNYSRARPRLFPLI